MKINVSAPGKVILHGEHAVVYGKAAVAVTISLCTKVSLTPCENIFSLQLNNFNLREEWNFSKINTDIFTEVDAEENIICVNDDIIEKIAETFGLNSSNNLQESSKQAIVAFLYLWLSIFKSNKKPLQACCVEVSSELSVGSGMGSSASYSVSIATALLLFSKTITAEFTPEDRTMINKWAYQAERIFHGKPSGIDNTVCTYGGALLYENGKIEDLLSNLPVVKMLLVNTKVPRNTKTLVANVRKQQMCYPAVVDSIMDAIDSISKHSWKLFKSLQSSSQEGGNFETLRDLIKMNHHLLDALNVSHPKLKKIHDVASRYPFPSKLTGAGGGGCALVLLPSESNMQSKVEELKVELQKCDCEVFNIVLGGQGVQAEVTEF